MKTGKKHKGKHYSKGGIQVVALLEAGKGLLVLFVGFGVLAFIHKDLHLAAEELVRHFHLNPASRYPRIFIDLTEHLTDRYLWALSFSAFLYSVIRVVEAYGLWHHQQWAEWFGLLTGAIYIPVELIEITRSATWPKVTVLVINVTVVGYLGYILFRLHYGRKHA